ncbi:MAG: hypothetical protein CVV27_09200 [Candidatus Melainabacteria bacterium HGW-Melainabacteria-1]|nr:MAG: hypothetical protein CVV27_09200 [Candidatus Melainabacteria bacterium HGW-Melainabacteria-1]
MMGSMAEHGQDEDDLSHHNTRENLYFWVVLLLGMTAFLSACLLTPGFWRVNGLDFLMFLVLTVIAEQTYVVLPHGSKISATFAILLAVLILFNPPIAVILASLSALFSMGVLQNRGWRIASFNAAQYALTYSLAGLAMSWTHHRVTYYLAENPLFESLISAGAATAVYLLLNLPLVNGYLAVKQHPELPWHKLGKYLIKIKDDRLEVFQTSFFYPIAVLVAYSYQREHNPIIPILLAFLVFGGLRFIDQRRRIGRQGEKMQVLYHLTKKMSESVLHEAEVEVDPGHVFDHLFTSEASSIKRLITNQRTSVYRVQQLGEDGRVVHAKSDSLLEPEKIYHLDEPGLLQEIVRTKQGVRLNALSDLGKSYSTWRITYQSLMAVPLLVDDEVTFILVMFRTAGDAFHERDERLLKLLINAFEITLKNLQLRNKIQEQAIKDGLMGVFNHRYMKVKLEEEMARAKRYASPLTLIIADVDYFKKFNDTHGHLLGDKVLKEIATILQDSVRETDIVARYGGEELAILLPETPLDAACDVAERIRSNVASHPFTGKDQQVVAMSLSIGVSSLLDEPDLEPSELIIRTDTALYRAKNQGRNQICRAQLERGRLVIETYSRGISPQAEPSEPPSNGLLRPELRKTWDDQLEKSLPELDRKLRHELEQAALGQSLERFFEKKLLPAIPELLKGMGHAELNVRGQLLPGSGLEALLEQLQQAAARRLQRTDQLRLLQLLLLKTYRHFVRLCLSLTASESERRTLFNQGWSLIMQIQDRLFLTSFERAEEQIGYARSQHRMAHQLLLVLAQYKQPEAALTEILRQVQAAVPQLHAVFLALPKALGEQMQMAAWLPQDAPLNLNLTLLDHGELTPKAAPCLLELGMQEVEDYLQWTGDLPASLPADLAPVLIPLWCEEQLYGLLGLLLPGEQPLSAAQRHWLKAAMIELADTLQLLALLQQQQSQQIETLKTLVEVVQGSQGSFRAERMASLAVRLARRLGLPGDEQQHLKDAAYLFQLGNLVIPARTPSQRRQVQMLNQRLLGALSLNGLEKPLRHVLERWDGSGFPDGLSAQGIPLTSRILGLVTAYVDKADESRPADEVLEELDASGYYDPKLCALLKDVIRESNN